MEIYKVGSAGENVRKIQQALINAGLYQGAADGVFGKQTEIAVGNFQSKSGLPADGIVGKMTWEKLFPSDTSSISAPSGDLPSRCLALTGSFETGQLAPGCFAAIAGNFDGQGISFGALQWNLGQGTLQPLLMEMYNNHHDIISKIFGDDLQVMKNAISGGKQSSLSFANSIQDASKKSVNSVWKSKFNSLGLTKEFQTIEVKGASAYYERAVKLCSDYGLRTNRGRALMFDICVQNGSISDNIKSLILSDFKMFQKDLSPEELEVSKMRSIANRRAEAANPKFVEDVRKRKLCIAEGKGVVHGISYDLAAQFKLNLENTG